MYAPSTGTRVAGGLNYREAYYICEASYNSSFLRSMDMVEVNPSVSPEGSTMTVNMAVGLVSSALGNKIL
jgi:arginase